MPARHNKQTAAPFDKPNLPTVNTAAASACFSAMTNRILKALSRVAARGAAISDSTKRSASDRTSTGLPDAT
jgi:hypothetical protein